MQDCEILIGAPMAARGEKMLAAMIAAAPEAGIHPIVSRRWTRASKYLMSYGLGHPDRRVWTEAHKRRGGRLIGWDLGYWLRDVPLQFHMRLTIDDDHPHREIEPMLGSAPSERWESYGIELRDDAYASGPIILVGLGAKQRQVSGYGPQQWERAQLQSLRARFPGRRIFYRPKRPEMSLDGLNAAMGRIEDAIKSSSLVVCAHSNVAVDACIAGIPVECDDGAALALYRNNPNPTRDERLAFLRALAWWQWNPTEALEAWTFIRSRLCA